MDQDIAVVGAIQS